MRNSAIETFVSFSGREQSVKDAQLLELFAHDCGFFSFAEMAALKFRNQLSLHVVISAEQEMHLTPEGEYRIDGADTDLPALGATLRIIETPVE